MTNRLFLIFVISISFFTSCQSQTTHQQDNDTLLSSQTLSAREPNYDYVVEVPDDWTIRDTVMQGGLRIRMLFSPPVLKVDYPAGNVLIASMEGQNIDDFVTSNINYLKSNMPNIVILEKGNIDSTVYNGQWFTYTREQNGLVRDMINYIIPLNGFAYMITCGSNKGTINKYRATFDKIAKSFKG